MWTCKFLSERSKNNSPCLSDREIYKTNYRYFPYIFFSFWLQITQEYFIHTMLASTLQVRETGLPRGNQWPFASHTGQLSHLRRTSHWRNVGKDTKRALGRTLQPRLQQQPKQGNHNTQYWTEIWSHCLW